MKKKTKAEFFLPEKSSEEKIKEDMAMTPRQRLKLAFRLADIALQIRKGKPLPPQDDSGIRWRELKFKNGKLRK